MENIHIIFPVVSMKICINIKLVYNYPDNEGILIIPWVNVNPIVARRGICIKEKN